MVSPTEVLSFWLEEVGTSGWYKQDDAVDAAIRDRFLEAWTAAEADLAALDDWCATPEGTLAALILVDQFPRNLFRGDGRSFATDGKARAVAKKAIERGWDLRLPEPQRQFFYTPLLHSECLYDQDRCVRLMATRLASVPDHLVHAKAHREVIRRFGRFPTRNEALQRPHTTPERAFVETEGGYGAVVRALRAA
ncbi:MAG: DUF924 family protein [Pseudomonadota bacterium]